MTATRRRSVALSFIGLLTAGCWFSVLDLRDNLDFNQASFHDKLAAKEALAKAFLAAGVIAKKLVEHEGFCYFQTIQQSENRNGTRPVTGAIFGPNATH